MAQHIGNKVKYLVDKHYTGTRKDFAHAIGLKNHTYVHKLFLKDNLNTEMLNKIAEVLNISIADIICDSTESVSEPGNNSEIIKTLKHTIKAQEVAIQSMQITIDMLQKNASPKMTYETKKKK